MFRECSAECAGLFLSAMQGCKGKRIGSQLAGVPGAKSFTQSCKDAQANPFLQSPSPPSSPPAPPPGTTQLTWLLGKPGQSCGQVCSRNSKSCSDSHWKVSKADFQQINQRYQLGCEHYSAGRWAGTPEVNVHMMTGSKNCYYPKTGNLRKFSGKRCDLHSRRDSRLCPCV